MDKNINHIYTFRYRECVKDMMDTHCVHIKRIMTFADNVPVDELQA